MSMRDVTAQDVVFRKRGNGFEAAAAQLRNLLNASSTTPSCVG
jgi:hypothetical protein